MLGRGLSSIAKQPTVMCMLVGEQDSAGQACQAGSSLCPSYKLLKARQSMAKLRLAPQNIIAASQACKERCILLSKWLPLQLHEAETSPRNLFAHQLVSAGVVSRGTIASAEGAPCSLSLV